MKFVYLGNFSEINCFSNSKMSQLLSQLTQLTDSEDEDTVEVLYGQFRADIVGIRYYTGRVNNKEMVALCREPNNQYDKNAIRVVNVFGQQVGHIKKEQAAALAFVMDKKYALKVEGLLFTFSFLIKAIKFY